MKIKLWVKRKINKFKKHKFILPLVIVFTLLIVLGGVYYFYFFQINLKGLSNVKVKYNGEYSEKGYNAKYMGKDISKDVSIKGKVNTKKLGTYKVTYSVKKYGIKKTVTRNVSVVDVEKPKMSISKDDVYICPGDEFVPENVEVTDNYDKDLTKKVKVDLSKKKDKVTYSVKDSSGNISSITKNVYYKDIEKPVITLNGGEIISAFIGGNYEELGVTVTDNCTKNISEKVNTNGSVNINKIGEYTITYSVKDDAGNENSISRKVNVRERNRPGTIYLTFDDGPQEGTTNVILDILKEEGVEATFFVTNKGPDYLIKREFDEGHSVALHTASHDYSIVYASVDSYYNDLYSVQNRVKRITGYESKIIRFPGGASNTVSRKYAPGIMSTLTKDVVNRGFRYYDWNLSSGDAAGGSPAPSTIYNNVVGSLRKDRVNMVLMHDIKTYTRDALRDIIRYGKNNGYTFEKITMDTEMITQRVNN